MTFGLVSSVFDCLTFGVLALLFRSTPEQFRTGWFVESVLSASLIVLVIRTRKPFFQSRPSQALALATLIVVAATVVLPMTPLSPLLGFRPLGPVVIAALAGILGLYIVSAEMVNRTFYKRVEEMLARSVPPTST